MAVKNKALIQALIVGDINQVIRDTLAEESWISVPRRTSLCKKLRRRIALHQTGEGATRKTPLKINVAEQQADLDIERGAK